MEKRECIKYWTTQIMPDGRTKSAGRAEVALATLQQEFVKAAQEAGFSYPSLFSRASGIHTDTLSLFLRGKTVLSPENMFKAQEEFAVGKRSTLWDLYGEELAKGKGRFGKLGGTDAAKRAGVNAWKTRKGVR